MRLFCGVCDLLFKKDSWGYIDCRKHCGQTKAFILFLFLRLLLLNVSIVKPHFITLTNVSTSPEKGFETTFYFPCKDKSKY
jgi:hypothetical protein